MKNGMSLTPFTCALKHLILDFSDFARLSCVTLHFSRLMDSCLRHLVNTSLANLKAGEWPDDERLLLYTDVQETAGLAPRVRFSMMEVSRTDMTAVDGHLSLVNTVFADDMKGWTLVRVVGNRCSPQSIVTRCTLYQQFTTEEALETAADSYGGLTRPGILSGG